MHRFMEKVLKVGDCWEWLGSKDNEGYPRYWWAGRTGKATHYVIEELLSLTIGPLEIVMHLCDNPSCVRPEHLKVGTQQENIRDCWNKQRADPHAPIMLGEANGNSKLTANDVLEIRRLYASGVRQSAIAKRFNVSKYAIYSIRAGLTWAHL